MSTLATTASDHTAPLIGGHQHFLLRRLHSLTGLIFGGYLVIHLLVNATIAQGGEVYQTQVNKIHDLPFLPVIEWIFIYLPILYHTIYGVWITLTGQPNLASYPYGKNWHYTLQRLSAVIIVIFIVFHVLSLKYGAFNWIAPTFRFDPHRALGTVGDHFATSRFVAWFLYPVGILASCYHLANGVWTAGITWGLTVSREAQRRWGVVCVGLFLLTFSAGIIALIAGINLPPDQGVPPVH